MSSKKRKQTRELKNSLNSKMEIIIGMAGNKVWRQDSTKFAHTAAVKLRNTSVLMTPALYCPTLRLKACTY